MAASESGQPVAGSMASRLPLIGGRLCLDFVNSTEWIGPSEGRDALVGYDELCDWGQRTGLVTAAEGAGLRAAGRVLPSEAGVAVAAAAGLRRAIRTICLAGLDGAEPPAEALARLNATLASATAAVVLDREAGRYACVPAGDGSLDGWLLGPAAWSCVELLATTGLGRVRLCAGSPCGWLFLDDSKSGNRRWCSMEYCGNRAKARAHYHRHARRAPEKDP